MTIISSLRFLYILGGSGLLCGSWFSFSAIYWLVANLMVGCRAPGSFIKFIYSEKAKKYDEISSFFDACATEVVTK